MALPPAAAAATKRFNPYALKLSGRVPPWSTLHHRGRRSARSYATPVMAFAARRPGERDVLVVHPLPWGADVDWCRNIRAAGSYELTRKNVEYRVDRLEVVDAEEIAPLLHGLPRAALSSGRFDQVLVGRVRRIAGT
ncbi:nitroreductase [Cellulosimicrobium terreum]|nr:nitroreductase [Cellulosimicrobium terreum]